MPQSAYRLRRRVQFHEVDGAGLVHFSCFFRYMEEAEHALWRAAGLSIAAPDAHVGFPRVAATCDYLAPLRFEDEFDVHVRVETVSRRSIRYAHVIRRGETRIATGALTVACVGHTPGSPFRAIDIPKEIAARLRSSA